MPHTRRAASPGGGDVIPSGNVGRVAFEIDAKAMADACKAACAWTDDENRGVDFSADGNALTLSHRRSGGSLSLPLTAEVSEAATVSLDPRYVRDALNNRPKGERVTFSIGPAQTRGNYQGQRTGPVLVTGESGRAIVMPRCGDE